MQSYSNASKWSRNISEETQIDTNRVRLIERQRQLLESKRQRQQQCVPTITAATRQQLSRSAKSIASLDKQNQEWLLEQDVKSINNTLEGVSNLALSSSDDAIKDLSLSSPEKEIENEKVIKSQSRPSKFNEDFKGQKSSLKHQQTTESKTNFDGNDEPSSVSSSPKIEYLEQSKKITDTQELNPLTTMLNNHELLLFVTQSVPPTKTYQCIIVRDKRGLDKSFYPTYYMHLQGIVSNEPPALTNESLLNVNSQSSPNGATNRYQSTSTSQMTNSQSSRRQVFLLGGRRRKRSKTYLIGNDPFDITRDNCIAKLKSNVLGTHFNAFRVQVDGQRFEIVSIIYETNVLGFKGPRKMTALVPKNPELTKTTDGTLFDIWKTNRKSIYQFKNKTPVWNEDTQSYVLNFHGRVTQASVKNFQLIQVGKQKEELFGSTIALTSPSDSPDSNGSPVTPTTPKSTSTTNYAPTIPAPVSTNSSQQPLDDGISMQFGRISEREFTCDVTWPMSLLQAFAIALSSFDSKLACE